MKEMLVWNELRRAEVWIPWAIRGLRFLAVLAAAWVLSRLAKSVLARVRMNAIRSMERRGDVSDFELENRAATVVTVLFTIVRWIIWVAAWVMALYELSFDIQPLLAGLGVAGLAFGLGAQSLIKDWLGGLFLLLEDQVRIGDSVVINDVTGQVEEINLRTTMVRSENGALHMIPNGSITALANSSREYSHFLFEAAISHRTDVDKALAILKEVGEKVSTDERFAHDVLTPFELLGVEKLGEKGTVIRGKIKTRPSRQLPVGRELNLRVKEAFDAAGILFPGPA